MAEEFVCCSAGIMHLFLIFVLPVAGLQLFIRKFMIIGTSSFLTEYKLTKLERRVPAKLLTTRFCSKLSSVKCKRFGS